MVAVLVSDLARRSILSTAVMFLLAGIGCGAAHWIEIDAHGPVVAVMAELALVSVPFTDALRTGAGELAQAGRLAGRALLRGLPPAFPAGGLLARLRGA